MTSRQRELIEATTEGLWCAEGGFHVDPWRPVPLALVTHAHSDHARPGSARYLASAPSVPLLRQRLGAEADIVGVPFGEPMRLGTTTASFHPAGHVLGSAQVRIEGPGGTWVVTGDFKRQPDPSCEPFEPVRCDTLVTEATFALPVYRWPDPVEVARSILSWWDENAAEGRASVLLGYALGKAQRLLAELARITDRPAYLHGALVGMTEAYRAAGIAMLPIEPVSVKDRRYHFPGDLVLAPPSAAASPWIRRFGDCSTAFASGWMQVRGVRRRRAYDRGFVLSDHADWDGLLRTIDECGCTRVLTTHGYGGALVRFLRERGTAAQELRTPYTGEGDGDGDPGTEPGEPSP